MASRRTNILLLATLLGCGSAKPLEVPGTADASDGAATGNCRTDADCPPPDGLCSPSYPLFGGPPLGVIGFFCHTPSDRCRVDDDCRTPEAFCAFDTQHGLWDCSIDRIAD
jgi:hypothetical protein